MVDETRATNEDEQTILVMCGRRWIKLDRKLAAALIGALADALEDGLSQTIEI